MEEYFATISNITEADKVRFGGVNLRGQAASWWRDIGSGATRPQTWAAFVAELRRMFMPMARGRLARQKLANARQRDQESVSNYINYMRRLFLAIPRIADDEKVDRFVRGLSQPLQDKVAEKLDERGEDAVTFEEAAAVAARFEALLLGKRRGPMRNDRPPDNNSGPAPMELGAMNGGNQRAGPPGHKDLPKGSGCWHCGEEGHIARHCPKRQNNPKGYNPR